jgi:hypothetical protein
VTALGRVGWGKEKLAGDTRWLPTAVSFSFSFFETVTTWLWQGMPVIPAFGKARQEDCEFEASLRQGLM